MLSADSLNELKDGLDQFRCDSGYFSEYHASSLLELSIIINRKYQTLAYYGFSKKESGITTERDVVDPSWDIKQKFNENKKDVSKYNKYKDVHS